MPRRRNNGTERNDPSVPTIPIEDMTGRHRMPRETGGIRVSAATVKAVGLAVAFAGVVWGAAVFANGKADSGDVKEIDKRVQKVETTVEVIRTQQATMLREQREMMHDQRMLIRALRPDLPAGRDD